MHHPGYDPLWRSACDAGLAIGFHPYQAADLRAIAGDNARALYRI